ncbi:MAG: hypothetical protein ACTSRH_13015 [Promethearchaeota archaeon]
MLEKIVLFDSCHNEMLNIDDPDYKDFKALLQRMNLRIRKNDNQNINRKILQNINILIIGNPINNYFSTIEIKSICDFVRAGGNLLLISEYGSDLLQKTNLNDLTGKHFGIFLEKTLVKKREKDVKKSSSIIKIRKEISKEFSNGIVEIIIGGSCSLFLTKNAKPILKTDDNNAWSETYNASTGKWIREKEQQQILAACSSYGLGKVACIGDIDIFTNDERIGINALDNRQFVQNLINWFLKPVEEQDTIKFIINQLNEFKAEMKEMNTLLNNALESLASLEKRVEILEKSPALILTSQKKNSKEPEREISD